MISTTASEIEFRNGGESASSSIPSVSSSPIFQRLLWFEFKRQSVLFIFFPILGITALLIAKWTPISSFPGLYTWKRVAGLWPLIHLALSGVIAFGPDYENDSFLWDQWFPADWRKKFSAKLIVMIAGLVSSTIPIYFAAGFLDQSFKEFFQFLFRQDMTLILPFVFLAILLTILNPAIIRNFFVTLFVAAAFGVHSERLIENNWAWVLGNSITDWNTFFWMRFFIGTCSIIAIPIAFRWRMTSEGNILFFRPFSKVFSLQPNTQVLIGRKPNRLLAFSFFIIRKNSWIVFGLLTLLLFNFIASLARIRIATTLEISFVISVVTSVCVTWVFGNHIGDRQREFFRQLPISPIAFLLTAILFLGIMPLIFILIVSWSSIENSLQTLLVLSSVILINCCIGMYFRSKLIAWSLGTTISVLHGIILLSASSICNNTFLFYLSLTVIPFGVSILRNLPRYFQDDQLRFGKQMMTTIGLWAFSTIALLLTGRVYSIPYAEDPIAEVLPAETSFRLPNLPEPFHRLKYKTIGQMKLFDHQAVLLASGLVSSRVEDDNTTVRFYRPTNRFRVSHRLQRFIEKMQETHPDFNLGREDYSYAVRLDSEDEISNWKKSGKNQHWPNLQALKRSVDDKQGYESYDARSRNNHTEVDPMFRTIFGVL